MGYVLIIAEKPSQGRAYANAFNIKQKHRTHIELNNCPTFPSGAVITWGIGHLIELYMPYEYDERYKKWSFANLPIAPETFKYKVSHGTKDHYKVVEKLMKQANEIIIATDIDREGELIARLVINQAGVEDKPMRRLWVNSEVDEEIRQAFTRLTPASDSYNLYLEAQARQHADWLVGMNLSPLYSLLLQQKGFSGSLSIGRVQTPTVKIIYDRQKEIENFVSKPFYRLNSTFTTRNNEVYEGVANVRLDTKEDVRNYLSEHGLQQEDEGHIKSISTKERRNLAPKLHSISSLQYKANKIWKYGSQQVLDTVQSLYEKKIVSYPRTDCTYIGDKEFAYLVNHLEAYKRVVGTTFETVSTEPKTRYVNNEKVTEHYALIPTQKVPSNDEVNKLSEMEKNIYNEILVTTLGMFHRDYLYEETVIMTEVKGVEFRTRGRVEKDKGWREISLEKENTKDKMLPSLTENEEVNAKLKVEEKHTSPPKPYTEGQLIRLMETAGRLVEGEDGEELEEIDGIGTGATRAGIIERIKQQGYVEIKRNVAHVTKKGSILCEAVEGTLLASPTMTAQWETYLKKIGNGNGSKDSFINNILKFIHHQIKTAPKGVLGGNLNKLIEEDAESQSVAKCPSCEGRIVERKNFYGCTGYSNGCRVTFPKKLAGKNITKTIVKTLCEKKKTKKLKGFKSNKGKKFETILTLDKKNNIKFSSY